ncbi:protein of unknown function [Methylorubrum extorquens]|uniref:DUF1508 domain-containing protein n=1 Tax=Methylorubrum extorquens TaxID=408 RepID=A0A2N9AJT5_METEX|nr:protein of unknown function [Methylorubrum extorquens]
MSMSAPTHPFVVDVKRLHFGGHAFTWSIKRRGAVMDHSSAPYSSFEAARLDMKAALNVLIASWEARR